MAPAIVSGSAYDESFIHVAINGETVIDNLRVATLPAGSIEKLARYISTNDPALIALSNHYAVVDENKLTNVTDEAVTIQMTAPGSTKELGEQAATASVCIRPFTLYGPGIVKWQMNNPGRSRWGYSFLPEGLPNLKWASPPSNNIDGLYNKSWGCRTALKVPNTCTVSFNGSSYSACCNNLGLLLGYKVEWVTPGQGYESGWPTCPLF